MRQRLWLVGGLMVAAVAQADCVDTVGLDAAERQFLGQAQAALKALLRPAPEGAGIRWKDGEGAAGQVTTCQGSARQSGAFSPYVSRKFIWPDPNKMRGDATVEIVLTLNAPSLPGADVGGAAGPARAQRSAGLMVHNVSWVAKKGGWGVPAQEEQLRAAVLAALDTQRLAALVGRPLPTLAESKAAAAAATAFAMGAPGATPTTTGTAKSAAAPAAPAAPAASSAGPAAKLVRGAAAVASDAVESASGMANSLKGLWGR